MKNDDSAWKIKISHDEQKLYGETKNPWNGQEKMSTHRKAASLSSSGHSTLLRTRIPCGPTRRGGNIPSCSEPVTVSNGAKPFGTVSTTGRFRTEWVEVTAEASNSGPASISNWANGWVEVTTEPEASNSGPVSISNWVKSDDATSESLTGARASNKVA